MNTTNSFWREVLDYLPNLAMIFRIDKNDHTQLIFVNKKINDTLGFSPQEFVLASETETLVQRELDALIEAVARFSHSKTETDKQETSLHTKRGEKKLFGYDFELFKVKSSPASFLSINFKDATQNQQPDNAQHKAKPFFVAGSPAMNAVMGHVDNLISSDSHVLVRGEKSTGKRTIARMIARPAELSGSKVIELNAGSEPLSILKKQSNDQGPLILLMKDIGKLSKSDQGLLKQFLDQRNEKALKTRIIATSSQALESLIEQDHFEADLYYMLSFHPVLLPPLRNRKEDIEEITRQWISRSSQAMNLPEMKLPPHELTKLVNSKWNGNFEELYQLLRNSILAPNNGTFVIKDTPDEAIPEPVESGNGEDILPYDEMNRLYLSKVLKKTQDKIYGKDGAASLLGLKPTTLQSKLKKLGIR
ncbi:MAG: sigma 54-interacting transcriptional regulator [Balneolales bacterium]